MLRGPFRCNSVRGGSQESSAHAEAPLEKTADKVGLVVEVGENVRFTIPGGAMPNTDYHAAIRDAISVVLKAGGLMNCDVETIDGPEDAKNLSKPCVAVCCVGPQASDLETTIKAVREVKPCAKLEIRINRDGKESTITATVGPFPFHYVVGLE